MKKKSLVIIVLFIIIVLVICFLGFNPNNQSVDNEVKNVESIAVVNNIEEDVLLPENEENNTISNEITPKNEQKGTAGSNMPLKDNDEEAIYQIEVAMQYLLEELYGDDVYDTRMHVEKIYTAEEEHKNPFLKRMNLSLDEIAFEVNYEIRPSEGADIDVLTLPDGEYDEETGWITGIKRVGILRTTDDENQKYKITNLGTEFK